MATCMHADVQLFTRVNMATQTPMHVSTNVYTQVQSMPMSVHMSFTLVIQLMDHVLVASPRSIQHAVGWAVHARQRVLCVGIRTCALTCA